MSTRDELIAAGLLRPATKPLGDGVVPTLSTTPATVLLDDRGRRVARLAIAEGRKVRKP